VSPRAALRKIAERGEHGQPAERGEHRAAPRIRLTGDRILVGVPSDSERKSKGGLLIPATAATPVKRCAWSDVILVGPDTRNVKTGDRVLFIPHSGIEADVDGEVYLLLRERDIQAIASDRPDLQAGQYL
jgi:chaperonin GroES